MTRGSVDYVLVEPRPDSPVSAKNKWDKDNKLARSHIVLNLGPAPLITVASLLQSQTLSKDIWDKLKSSYLKVDLQAKLNIRNKLASIKFHSKKNFQDHLNEFQMHFLNLARLGDEIAQVDPSGPALTLPARLISCLECPRRGNRKRSKWFHQSYLLRA